MKNVVMFLAIAIIIVAFALIPTYFLYGGY